MNQFNIFVVFLLIYGLWNSVNSFDPNEGYPRSKYNKKTSNSNDESVHSDYSMNYECGAQNAENHPWIAIVEHTDPTDKTKRKTLSKGVFIGPQHILTTVSSIHNSHPFWVVSGVRLGDSPTWALDNIDHNSSYVVRREIDEVYIHESKDIALIKLSQRVQITDDIQPVCLPKHGHYEFRELHSHICKRLKNIPMKKKAKVIVSQVLPISPRDCHIMFRRKGATLTNEEFCAWDDLGDTCTGDLGSPLIGKHNGRFYVVGLKSYALSTNTVNGNDTPGVYTKVGSHIKWIRQLMNISNNNNI